MKSLQILLIFGSSFTTTVKSLQTAQPLPPNQTVGFSGPVTQSYSAGNLATCIAGKVAVSVNATNFHILYSEPANQSVVTEFFQELTQIKSTLAARTVGEVNVIQATYKIDATLCFPVNNTKGTKVTAVQVLVHGTGLDKSYWDIAPGYSYVDTAASNGYATLAYNRLGCGESDHPDPIQVVQAPMDVEIQHGLVHLLRDGTLGGLKPKNIVTVGHSYGSVILQGENTKYPKDADASVLTGFASEAAYLGTTFAANNPAIAALNEPSKFAGLPNGYVVHNDAISYQLPFFRFPYFDPESKSSSVDPSQTNDSYTDHQSSTTSLPRNSPTQ